MLSLKGEMFMVDNQGNISKFRARCGFVGGFRMDYKSFLSISNNGRMGVVQTVPYDTIIPAKYLKVKTFSQVNVFVVKDDNEKWGIVNIKDEVLVPFTYAVINIQESGGTRFFLTNNDDHFGAFNLEGELMAKLKYNNLRCYPGTEIMVTQLLNGTNGYIYQGREYWK